MNGKVTGPAVYCLRDAAGAYARRTATVLRPAMKLEITLSTDERIALRRLAAKLDTSTEDAAKTALRDWLIMKGYLDSETADNDNEDEETRNGV